ncbi:MAG TPA: TetR/AcrR family transcriptional regulator [Acidimicrobiia bacterium]|nr:TetR/AcrR family transcriptional regulator [Acidimicrobiia bacterium]
MSTTRRGPGRPTGSNAGETRAELLAAARAVFSERGFAGAGIAEIVARAGVSAPVLYHHFAGKADLYLAVAADVYDEVLSALEAAGGSGGRFPDRLDAMLAAAADLNETDPTIGGFANAMPADLRLTPELAPLRDQMGRVRTFFLALAAASPDIPKQRRDAVADACAALIAGLSRAGAIQSSPAEFRRTVESLRLLVRGELF